MQLSSCHELKHSLAEATNPAVKTVFVLIRAKVSYPVSSEHKKIKKIIINKCY